MRRFLTLAALAGATAAFGGGSAAEIALAANPGDGFAAVCNRVRSELKAGKAVTVTLAPGTYAFPETHFFGPADSGSADRPVVWRAERPGTVRLRGGLTIPAGDLRPVDDPAMRERFPEAVRDRVRTADLSKFLPKPLKPWAKSFFIGAPPGPWVFADGRTLPLARWPNAGANDLTGPEPQADGWCYLTNSVDKGISPGDARTGKKGGKWPGAIAFADPRARRWRVDAGVWMFGYWAYDWHGEYLQVASFTPSNNVVRFAAPTAFGIAANRAAPPKRRYCVLNLPEELDAPGEWWIDRETRRLYLIPPAGAREISVARAQPILCLRGVRNLRFENLTVECSYGEGAGVCLQECENVILSHCRLTEHGCTAIQISGGFGNRVEDSLVSRTGSTAVSIDGGSREALVPGRNALVRCEVSHCCTMGKAAGVSVRGCGNALRDCEIHDAPSCAFRYRGNDHLFADCRIHRVVLEDHDAGPVYTGADPSSQGSILFGNALFDCSDREQHYGFYCDDNDWGDTFIGNSVCGQTDGFLLTGCMHYLYNNVIADCTVGVSLSGRSWHWKRNERGAFGPDADTGLGFAESKLVPFNYRAAPWSVAYPRLPSVVDSSPEAALETIVTNNVIVGCGKPFEWRRLGAWIARGKYVKFSEATLATLDPVRDAPEPPTAFNTILSKIPPAGIPKPVRPIDFTAAKTTRLASPDGATAVTVALDVSGRLSWRLVRAGEERVAVSPLGLTVDNRDLGRAVIPLEAALSQGDGVPVTNVLTRSDYDRPYRGTLAAGWRGATIPLADLVTGEVVASVEFRVFNGGAAYRWLVPGDGRHWISGEMNAWVFPKGQKKNPQILEAERSTYWPASETQKRVCKSAGLVRGITFPERPRGFRIAGALVSPWRVTLD